ncbi:glycosyl hydrolase [Anaerosporobacter sp.]|uniref:glycosyl hydrolase n=1 Tax=Anaerosporobacter sp. TaxID=1872529 RepID=UPI00286F804D|nr:glycosyl hydrolase [Anaerosporobacter sp.]
MVYRVYKIMAIVVVSLLGLTNCSRQAEKKTIQDNTKSDNVSSDNSSTLIVNSSVPKFQNKVSVWITYWETAGIEEEWNAWKSYSKQINYFAAYFKEDGNLFVPDTIEETKKSIEELSETEQLPTYLTIVNDQEKADGTSSLKDTKLLYSLFKSEKTMKKHSSEIIELAIDGGYDGIEIDYEAIRNDWTLWKKYMRFLEILVKQAEECNLSIRVLLEPSIKVDKITFTEGIEYIMMCYNLYGSGTKAGPKADKDFLISMIKKMKKVSKKRGYAIATGGFDFASDGKVTALTIVEAKDLQLAKGKNIYRDKDSKSMVFTYTKGGIKHEVWYADEETVQYLVEVLEKKGEKNISIWRLGGTIYK